MGGREGNMFVARCRAFRFQEFTKVESEGSKQEERNQQKKSWMVVVEVAVADERFLCM